MRRPAIACSLILLALDAGAGSGAATAPPATPVFQVSVTGKGRPMLLIPGLGCSGEVWAGTVNHFRGRYACHVLTLAGFAGVPPVRAPSLDQVRDQVIAYIRRERLEQPVLVGHSLGGALAMSVAAAAPELVAAVVSVDGLPFLAALHDPAATAETVRPQARAMAAAYGATSPADLGQMARAALATMITDPEDVERASAWMAASDPATVGALTGELLATDLRPALARIQAPLLLVAAAPPPAAAGLRDRLLEGYARQVKDVPRAQVVMAASARHFVMLDAPEELHREIDRFLAAPAGEPAAAEPAAEAAR